MRYRNAIFDLDGTLTRPGLIDFDAIKDAIGCPRDHTIIEYLGCLGRAPLRRAWAIIDAHERAAVTAARPNVGAHRVLATLNLLGARCFVLTRNSRAVTRATLHCLHLHREIVDYVCREDVAPKPDPAGIRRLHARWSLDARRTLMVGDFRFDVLTGAAAGVATAFLTNRAPQENGGNFPPGHPTHVIRDLEALLPLF